MNSFDASSSVRTYDTDSGTFAIDTKADAKIASSLRQGAGHQRDVLDILLAYTEGGGTVVDVGAHIGTISVPLALKDRRVVSFEPNPSAYSLLVHNADVNHVSIDARRKGLGDRPGRATMITAGRGNAGANSLSEGSGDIEVARLDDEVDQASALKIDVEGMELSVLRGARRLIERSKPVIIFEVNPLPMRAHGVTAEAIESFFHTCGGYRLFLPMPGKTHIQLGAVRNLHLIIRLLSPGSFLSGRRSVVFDVLALPDHRTPLFPMLSAPRTIWRLATWKISDIVHRYLMRA